MKKVRASARARPMSAQEKRWQAEDDMNVLMRAEEIRASKSRVAAAQKIAAEKAREAAKIASKLKR